jgi:acyl-CoA thioesterase-1
MIVSVRIAVLFVTALFQTTISYGSAQAADQLAQDKPGPIRILAFGDSLTAGYGLDDMDDAFPNQLERALEAAGHDVDVLQAGVSGETTTGGLNRIDWSLAEKPDAVIVALGGNDGLRAIDPAVTEKSLDGIVARIRDDGTPVLIAGMLAPPNLGRDYADQFGALFGRVAKKYDAVFYPFFLDGVAAVPNLNQADRIHPNPKGVALMVEKITPYVETLIEQVQARR